jgi:antirestriction protein ArdC
MPTRKTEYDKPPPRDFRQEVTDDIIRLLEEGKAPWQKPWEDTQAGRTPYNPTTDKAYRGGNVIALMIAGMRRGYADPRWMTYKQAAEQGWQVRKGEKASQIEYWEPRAGSKEEDADGDEKRGRLIHRIYSVFNAQQIDGIPALVFEPRKPFEVIEAGERILRDSGAMIRHGGNRAFYNRTGDYVQLPEKEQFIDAPAYYATGCHELIHWSGNEHRLNRETLLKSRGYSPTDEHYAREELVAELGSMMLAAETGIPHDPAQHAAYVQSWLEALKKDKNEIFRAASAASKAADYVLGVSRAVESPSGHGPHASNAVESRDTARRTR